MAYWYTVFTLANFPIADLIVCKFETFHLPKSLLESLIKWKLLIAFAKVDDFLKVEGKVCFGTPLYKFHHIFKICTLKKPIAPSRFRSKKQENGIFKQRTRKGNI